MTKLSIITAELIMNRGIPQIVLVGRDDSGKKRMYKTTFYPYILMEEKDYLRYVKEVGALSRFVIDVEGSYLRTLDRQILTKVTLRDPKYVSTFIHQISKTNKVLLDNSIWTYEGDLSMGSYIPIRFLIDKGIKTGVEIDDSSGICNFSPVDMDTKLRIWFIDFEALTFKQGSFNPRNKDPIPIVTFYDTYEDKLYTLFVRNAKWFGRGPAFTTDKIIESVCPDEVKIHHEILYYNNEGQLLEALANLVKEKDPDLITAWNLDRYDINKWIDRMKANHLDPATLSPFKTFNGKSHPYKIKGRILFDLMRAFKRFTDSEIRSYALGAVAEEEKLGVDKIPFKQSTQWLWDNEPVVLFKRNINDVLIMIALDKKYDLINMFDDLRKEFGALFSEVLMNYRLIDTALMRMVQIKGIALRTVTGQEKGEDSYLGAVVVEPIAGLHHFIAQFDFSREYPSMIKAFNISPETYRQPDFKGDCYRIEYQGKVFHFVKKPIGQIPNLINYFFNKRTEYEKKYVDAINKKLPENEIKLWYRRVYNMKKTTNAIYGVMDFGKFRLYNQNCSAATAILGRISVEEIAKFVSSGGYQMVYGDTDSVFIQLKAKTQEEAVEEGKELQKNINSRLATFFGTNYDLPAAPTDMGLKKIYDSFLMVAKKNYAGHSFWDEKKGYKEEWDFKGLEMIRSDSSDLEKVFMEEVVRKILMGASSGNIITMKGEVLGKLTRKEFTPIQVAYPQQIKEKLSVYPKPDKNGRPNMPAHVRAAIYSNTYLETDFQLGDKPRRLPIKESVLKVEKNQRTLFSKDEPHSTECVWNKFKFALRDISITEDINVPTWLINRIDYDRIIERLVSKIDKVLGLIKNEKYR